MRYLRCVFSLVGLLTISCFVQAQPSNELFYRHSIQLNVAGLAFERWGIAYEIRLTPRHALFFQEVARSLLSQRKRNMGLDYTTNIFSNPFQMPNSYG